MKQSLTFQIIGSQLDSWPNNRGILDQLLLFSFISMNQNAPSTNDFKETIVIGPIFPYRGGISQYNTSLVRSMLSLGLTKVAVSFSRQYPSWLYPGKTDKESGDQELVEPNVNFSIDSVNPMTWWMTYRNIVKRQPRLVVFHWWTVFLGPCFSLMMLMLKRKQIPTALICHNLEDHDASRWKSWIASWTLSLADAYLVHSSEHIRVLKGRFPTKTIAFHPIPLYDHYPAAKGLLPKRGRLELLFFGFIRPYKGLDLLLDALVTLDDPEVHLTVAGESWDELDLTAAKNALGERLDLKLKYTSDLEAAEYFARADIVVLPYRAATGSAVAAVAHRYGKPLLATRVGGLPDVVIDGRTGILVKPGDSAAIANAVRELTREEAVRLSQGVERFTQRWSWESLAKTVSALEKPSEHHGLKHE